MKRPTVLCLLPVIALASVLSAGAQPLPAAEHALASWLSTAGSFSIVPIDTWGSGDFDALSDALWGYSTPRLNQLTIDMDQTACTTYEGELFFKKLRLKFGLDIDVDNNLIGRLDRFMGYINYDGFTLRVQTSELRGTAFWTGTTLPGMPAAYPFDNPFVSVDLLYYRQSGGIDYFGAGYTSYRLPVQLTILTYDPAHESVWWAEPQSTAYQPDMAFHIYSALFGLDTLHEALTRTGTFAGMQGLTVWMATQDRAGVGLAYISDETRGWIEAADGLPLWSATQIAMLVDYDLILGAQWVGDLGPVRLGMGLGFEVGGQMVTCVTPKGPVDSNHVDASPSFYLFHYGPILKATVSW